MKLVIWFGLHGGTEMFRSARSVPHPSRQCPNTGKPVKKLAEMERIHAPLAHLRQPLRFADAAGCCAG